MTTLILALSHQIATGIASLSQCLYVLFLYVYIQYYYFELIIHLHANNCVGYIFDYVHDYMTSHDFYPPPDEVGEGG